MLPFHKAGLNITVKENGIFIDVIYKVTSEKIETVLKHKQKSSNISPISSSMLLSCNAMVSKNGFAKIRYKSEIKRKPYVYPYISSIFTLAHLH